MKISLRLRHIALICLFLSMGGSFSPYSAFAQTERTLRFIPDELNFGYIKEEDGKVTHTVKAINISNDSTFIISARTSCGCSSLSYPEYNIAPGDTVEISVTYDPINRPGKFLKTAKIFTGKERIGNTFKLNGNVIPSKKNLDMAYPEKAGDLRLSSLLINAGEVSRKEVRPLFVGIYNDSGHDLKLDAVTDGEALEAALTPDSLGTCEVSTLTLMLKGRLLKMTEKDFFYNAYLVERSSGDTIACIPVGGSVKR